MKSILAVTTAATSRDLTRVDTVKADLDLTGNDANAVLLRYIRAASSQIVGHCRRELAAEAVSETWRLTWQDRRMLCAAREPQPLQLERFPVSTVASVTFDGIALVAGTDYELDAELGQLWRLDGAASPDTPQRVRWPGGSTATTGSGTLIVAGYTGGYALLDELPDAVEDACIQLVKQRWFARKRDPLVRAEQTEGVGRDEYWVGGLPGAEEMPPEIAALLQPYRAQVL